MNVCKKCNKEFTPQTGLVNYCSLVCRNSRTWSEKDKLKKSIAAKNSIKLKHPTKGLLGPANPKWIPRTQSRCLYCNDFIQHKVGEIKKYHAGCWKKCSGGYRRGSGYGKSGWYRGYWCDSSYELVWVIYNLDHDIPFKRNTRVFEYIWENKICKYIPDFESNGMLIEIKGYINPQTKAKLEAVPGIKVLCKDDLIVEFEYVKSKYGEEFITLYEGNPYNEMTSTCKVCGNKCKKRNVYCSRKCAGIGNNRNTKLNKVI